MVCPAFTEVAPSDFKGRLRQQAWKDRTPLSVSFEVTYRCNVRCVHCYIGDQRFTPREGELTLDEVKRIIDECAEMGVLFITFTGGETFVRPDSVEMIAYARRRGLLPIVFTNGTLINRATVQKLAEMPPMYVEITLYGLTEKTYEQVTGIPGSYRRVMHAIELLQEFGIPLKLKSMGLRANIHELRGMQAFARQLGVPFRYDMKINAELTSSLKPHQHRVPVEEQVAIELADPELVKLLVLTDSQKTNGQNKNLLYNCGGGMTAFHIDPYGHMSICVMSRAESYDLRQGTVREGWQNFLQPIRMRPMPDDVRCAKCTIRSYCVQCPGWSEVEHGNLHEPVDFLCRLAHLRYEASQKLISQTSSEFIK